MSEKQQLRQQVKQLKQAISSEQRVALSQNICSAIEKLPGFETVSRILLYHALTDEVDTVLMLSRWSKKKTTVPTHSERRQSHRQPLRSSVP